MRNRFKWILGLVGIVLIGNFVILQEYGDALRSTHLFIVRGTVFYPVAWINLILGISMLVMLIWRRIRRKQNRSDF